MKVLITGAEGFIGRHVYEELKGAHDVVAGLNPNSTPKTHGESISINLRDGDAIRKALVSVNPEVLINCAGVVDSSAQPEDNLTMTRNILEVAHEHNGTLRRVILMGSAASYGLLSSADELPVNEATQLRADSGYALSKKLEDEFADRFAQENDFDVVIARIFNPIGKGMKARFLIPALIRQLNAVQHGQAGEVEVSRLDSERDYIDVRDVARAVRALAEAKTLNHRIYNVGSGLATSNKQLIDAITRSMGLSTTNITLLESSPYKEPRLASCADIRRLTEDTGWKPSLSLETTVEEIVNER